MALKLTTPLFLQLLKAYKEQRWGHASLISFSEEAHSFFTQTEIPLFIKTLFCTQKSNNQACNNCSSCTAFNSYSCEEMSHPDFKSILPEKEKGYTVEQIRKERSFFQLKAAQSELKLLWIQEADKLLASSGNALLKFLEEPQPNTFVLMSSLYPEQILETLRSRSQKFHLIHSSKAQNSAETVSTEWLPLKNWIWKGAPSHEIFSCPADEESFWKSRKEALSFFRQQILTLWSHFSRELTSLKLSSKEQLRVYDFFQNAQSFYSRVEKYGNAPSNWVHLKSNAWEASPSWN